ncbi:MAG: hypothetical protein WBA76_19595, partial [Phormidesmis sp.]
LYVALRKFHNTSETICQKWVRKYIGIMLRPSAYLVRNGLTYEFLSGYDLPYEYPACTSIRFQH